MTLDEAIEHCREKENCSACGQEHKQLRLWLEELRERRTATPTVETNIFDKETIIENCTVQILENTVTGEVSIGWWRNSMATVSYNQPSRCAHCGGQPKIRTSRHRGNVGGHYIECLSCGISTRHYPKLSDAVTAWNRRPNDRLPDGLKNVIENVT